MKACFSVVSELSLRISLRSEWERTYGQVIAELSCVGNHRVGDVIVLEGDWHAVTVEMGLERCPATRNFKHIKKSGLFTFLLLRNRLYFEKLHAQCTNLEYLGSQN